jgi:acetyltransferase
MGNKAVVNENDVLEYWSSNNNPPAAQEGLSSVSPIGLYLESIAGGTEFVRIASEISKTTPIFMLKPGKSKAAASAMHSHTGAIAGEDSVLDIALKQSGIVRCQELGEFFDLARAFTWENAPRGPRVAVVSNAGGPAVLSTDTINSVGLELASFSPETQAKLAASLPKMASYLNPVDVLGDALADRFGQALDDVMQEPLVDAAIVILTPQLMTQIEKTAEIIGSLSKKYSQPVFCSFIGGTSTAIGEKILNQYKIPSFPFPEMAINTLAKMWQWQKWVIEQSKLGVETPTELNQNLDTVKNIISSAKTAYRKNLDNFEANDVMSAAGIQTPPTLAVSDIPQSETFANGAGWPIVLKVSSPNLLHKADVGGVITHIHSSEELNIAWNTLSQKIEALDSETKKGVKIQAQKEISGGIEIIMGIKRDSNFGPVMLFGAGGKFAELFLDKNLHLLPITETSARQLIEGSKVFTLLKGFRGDPAYDIDPLIHAMIRLSELVKSTPDISEIEINPLIITHTGVWAVDSKVVLVAPPTPTFTVPQFKQATTIEHTILATKFHHLIFESEMPLKCEPGQFISIKVSDQRINAYSVANCVEPNKFELLIDIGPGGVGSKFFENLKVGDKITYLSSAGVFTLRPNDGANHLLFLGTGSGISPLRYMIEHALRDLKMEQQITLYFGVRFEEDVFWKDLFENLAKTYPNFHFKMCLSKPTPSWTGLSGHLTDFLKQDFPDASQCSVYLCGNKAMIEESTKILLENGCPQGRIYSEKFY